MKQSTNKCPACGTAMGINRHDGKLGCPHVACCYIGTSPRLRPQLGRRFLYHRRRYLLISKCRKYYAGRMYRTFRRAMQAMRDLARKVKKAA
jgi:ssDNA-binding Zn-finger/Zn-ribbon topoisomerase 1